MPSIELTHKLRDGKGVAVPLTIPLVSRQVKSLPGGPIMTKAVQVLAAIILTLSLVSVSFGGTIIGSRSSAAGARTGTIVGSRTGTIVGSRTGTIVGSRTDPRSQDDVDRVGTTLQDDLVIRLLVFVLGSSW